MNIGAPVAAENPERDRLTYTLTGTDTAAFAIVTTTGQIRVASGTTLDFETKSSYSVTVEVHDGLDGTGATSTTIDDTQDVTITVENVEEPGTVTLSSETATIQARVPVTASLEDDDGPTGITWQWSRSTNRSNWVNIGGATSDTFTPEDTDTGNYIRATVTYNDGEGSGKTAERVSQRVGQPPPVNSAPAFPATENGRREVAETSSAGTAIGDPFTASDFNNDQLTYTLSGTDAALFTIGTNDGQLRVAQDDTLDFESKRTLRVTVEVTDGADSLGDMESLTRLWLHGNMLDGSIPAALGDLTKLERLWLSDNDLTGELPKELGDLGYLVQWRLAGNDLDRLRAGGAGGCVGQRPRPARHRCLRRPADLQMGRPSVDVTSRSRGRHPCCRPRLPTIDGREDQRFGRGGKDGRSRGTGAGGHQHPVHFPDCAADNRHLPPRRVSGLGDRRAGHDGQLLSFGYCHCRVTVCLSRRACGDLGTASPGQSTKRHACKPHKAYAPTFNDAGGPVSASQF